MPRNRSWMSSSRREPLRDAEPNDEEKTTERDPRGLGRWLLVALLLATVYLFVHLAAGLALGEGEPTRADWIEIAAVPLVQTLALAGVAAMRRAVRRRETGLD